MGISRTAITLLCLLASCGGGGGGDGDDGPLVLPVPTGRVEGRITFLRPGGPPVFDTEPNDNLGQAQSLPNLFIGDTRSVFGSLDAASDAVDAYRVRVPLRAHVSISLQKAPTDDFDLTIHDPLTGQRIGESGELTPSFLLAYQGTLDVLVTAVAGAGNYELALAVETNFPELPESEPNDTPLTATPLGEVRAADAIRVIGDANQNGDPVDALLILVPGAGTLRFGLEMVPEDEDDEDARFSLRISDATADIGAATELARFNAFVGSPGERSLAVAADTLLLLEVLADSGVGTWTLDVAGALAPSKPATLSTKVLAPPLLRLSPASLSFGATRTDESSLVFNDGDEFLDVSSVEVNTIDGEDWLSASDVGAGDNTRNVDRIRVLVERAGLLAGSYAGEVTVRSNGGDIVIPVTMEVVQRPPPPPNLPIYVQAVSVETGDVVAEVVVNPATGLDYVFAGLPVGQYVFLASSDVDNDDERCEVGDFCGGFPTRDDLLPRTVVRGFTLRGIDFDVERDAVPIVPD